MTKGGKFIDDRGTLIHNNNFSFLDNKIERSYIIKHDRRFIRAFHGHRFENKWVQVIDGLFKLVFSKIDFSQSLRESIENKTKIKFSNLDEQNAYIDDLMIRSRWNPKSYYLEAPESVICWSNGDIIHIPAGYTHGFQNLTETGIIQFFSDATVEDSQKDDIRHNWDHFGSTVWSLEDYR